MAKKPTFPLVYQYVIDLTEAEHNFDQDFPSVRADLGYDPRCFRPLAVIATLGLMRDERLGALCNYPKKAREEIFQMTLAVIKQFDNLPKFPNYQDHHLDLICRYISYAVVDIATALNRQIRDKLAMEKTGSVECFLSVSPFYQPVEQDAVAVHFEVRMKSVSRYPFSISLPDEEKAPWKGEEKW